VLPSLLSRAWATHTPARTQIFIRNRLKYALTGREVTLVVKQRLIKVDNKVRTDETYPAGFMGQSRFT
jgi:ribosomal protein S4E